jgi:ketosteroid isomerase-like protein
VKNLWVCAFALLLTGPSPAPSPTRVSDQLLIRAMMTTFSAAFQARDVNTIMSLYEHSDNLVAYDVAPPLRYVGWEAYKKDYEQFLGSFKGPVSDELRDFNVFVEGPIAYSYDTERISGTLTSGHHAAMIVRVTDIYRKFGDKWLIVHEHVSVPVDFTTDKAVFEAKDAGAKPASPSR